MRKLKIAITTYSLSPGGVGNFIIDLAGFLKEMFSVEIICTDKPGDWFDRADNLVGAKKFNFGILGWVPFGRIIHSMRIGKYLKKGKFDLIINNHSFFVHASSHYYRPNTKLMTVIHNQLPQMVQMECSSTPEVVACVSNKIYEQAISYKKNNRIVAILNGARFPQNFVRQEKYTKEEKIRLLFVGRIENRQKAVFLLPMIISELNKNGCDVFLTIVGSGPDESKLKEFFNESGISSMVNFAGLVKADEVAKYYQNHHILLLPSYFEGLPLTIIEAMGNGCVPVASNLPDSTDICVNNGENGFLIAPGSVQGFVDKINYLADNPAELIKMSENSIKIANEEFSLAKAHQQYLNEIKALFLEKDKMSSDGGLNYKFPLKLWKEFFPFNLIMTYKKIRNKFNR
jgi:glycosyltransferase involved in cell wall biosynthesis